MHACCALGAIEWAIDWAIEWAIEWDWSTAASVALLAFHTYRSRGGHGVHPVEPDQGSTSGAQCAGGAA